ncbi:MAG: hypothetical protein QM802_18310 [Agriterribacter sp.]
MKRNFIVLIFLSSLISCTTPTKIVNSWRDPETTIKRPGVHAMVVAALIQDQVVRRQVEDYMVSLYPGKATQSYRLFGGDSLLTKDEPYYNELLKKEGYDGIVLMKQVSSKTTERYVPGKPPAYFTTWSGYWRGGWGNHWATTQYMPGTPGHIRKDWTWMVEVSVYSLKANKLIWAANTSTTNPGGRVPLFEDVCKAVHKEMRSDGFLN